MTKRKSDLEKFFDKSGCDKPDPQATAERLWPLTACCSSAVSCSLTRTAWSHVVDTMEGRGEMDGARARVLKRHVEAKR